MVAARIVLRKIQQRLRARGFNTRSYAICGVNELGIQLARNIERAPEMGLRLAGFYDDRPAERTAELPRRRRPSRVGNLDELVDRARRGDVDIIYITFPMRAEERIRERAGQAGRHDRQRVHRARLLRVRIAARPLDEHQRPAGGERVRKPALRRRRPGEADRRPGVRLAAAWRRPRVPMLVIGRARSSSRRRARCSSASGGTAWTAAKSWSGSSAR